MATPLDEQNPNVGFLSKPFQASVLAAHVREMLSRRYDLCDWTVVSTATLLTATDKPDKARWT